jgi:hypothetical protein
LFLNLQVKKEHSKASSLYPSNEIYRKENVQSPHLGPKTNASYGRNNNSQFQNQLKIKGQPVNIQEGYFQGFYPKHGVPPPPNIPHQANEQMFTKHEIEFHQKSVVVNSPQQFAQFHAQKYEGHDYEHHNMAKVDVNHKIPVNNVHARPVVEFPQNQIYYNENAAQNPHNQYYPNEFEVGNDGANAAAYFDPKTQAHYYDANYHHQHGGNEYSEMYGPNAVMNENCENFSSFQQYYEHQQQQNQQQPPPHQQNMHPHYHVPSGYVHQQNFNNSNPQIHQNPNHTENSNSSSDFNFLSNLNDFAPEYYQLS